MEAELIKHIRSLPGTDLIGDDAAVMGDRIITVDMLTEGVDFILADTDPQWIGRKALAVNLSDIAAMGGEPRWIFVAVALPRTGALKLAEQLLAGMQPLIERYDLILAGGDTNTWDSGLVVSITVIGKVTERGVFRRSGGKAGDRILVTGPLGGSILRHQFFFEPRISEALYLNKYYDIHSAIDISDGLTLDLHRLATESRVGATLLEASIPIAEDAQKLSQQSRRPPLEHALSDGEDFELLFSVAPHEAEKILSEQPLRSLSGTTLYDIGELTTESPTGTTCLLMVTPDGSTQPLIPRGFEH